MQNSSSMVGAPQVGKGGNSMVSNNSDDSTLKGTNLAPMPTTTLVTKPSYIMVIPEEEKPKTCKITMILMAFCSMLLAFVLLLLLPVLLLLLRVRWCTCFKEQVCVPLPKVAHSGNLLTSLMLTRDVYRVTDIISQRTERRIPCPS